MEIEQRQHLADLRGLAAPRRQNPGGEPPALPCDLIGPPVVDAGRTDLYRPSGRAHRPLAVVAVADHQALAPLITLVGELGHVLVDLGLQGGGQHPAGALADDVLDQGASPGRSIGVHYAQHGRAFPTRVRSAGLLGDQKSITREGTSFASNPRPIHRS